MHRIVRSLCGAAVFWLVLLPQADAAASFPSAPTEFKLSDQDGRERVVAYPRRSVSVFVVADQKGSSEIAGWIAPLYARYGERIDIAGIAALPGIPPMFHALFRREFKKRLTYPVMLDWTGDVAKAFGYEQKQAQLFVIGTDGRIALSKVGPANSNALAEVYRAVDKLESAR
jgi:hypothetical protein